MSCQAEYKLCPPSLSMLQSVSNDNNFSVRGFWAEMSLSFTFQTKKNLHLAISKDLNNLVISFL